MSNIEKIRQEIERQRGFIEGLFIEGDNNFYDGQDDAYNHLLAFIDSLPEEKPSEELGEAAEDCVWKSIDNNDPTLVPKFIPLLISLFISGAEWQKGQMMKEVKFGVVCKNGERDEEDVWIELNPGSLPDYKDTDPIDFIIVKEDDRPRD